MPSVIVLCSANSIRSPMAEGLWRLQAPDWKVESAGALGAGRLHPMVVQVLTEVGGEMDRFLSRDLSEVRGAFDLAVLLSEEAHERFPLVPFAAQTLFWPMPDPTASSSRDRLGAFRALRDELTAAIKSFLASKDP